MKSVVICTCTRKRPQGISVLVDSLEKLILPADCHVKIVIVENDKEGFTEKVLADLASKSKYEIRYFLETNQGISNARNRAVKEAGNCDFCCFVDDDQRVSPDWLYELLKCQDEFDADGVWGPNTPVFSNSVPAYIGKFHIPESYSYGTVVKKAYTNCLMLKKSWLDRFEGPFDIRLNFTGGEDSYLTSQISRSGGIIRYNPLAVAYEIIPESRTTIRYVMRRTFRMSNTRLFVNTLLDKDYLRMTVFLRLCLRFCKGLLISVPCLLFSGSNKLNGLIKVSDALGGFYFIFGMRNRFYK